MMAAVDVDETLVCLVALDAMAGTRLTSVLYRNVTFIRKNFNQVSPLVIYLLTISSHIQQVT